MQLPHYLRTDCNKNPHLRCSSTEWECFRTNYVTIRECSESGSNTKAGTHNTKCCQYNYESPDIEMSVALEIREMWLIVSVNRSDPMVQHKPSIHNIILVYSFELSSKHFHSHRSDIVTNGTCEEVPPRRIMCDERKDIPTRSNRQIMDTLPWAECTAALRTKQVEQDWNCSDYLS